MACAALVACIWISVRLRVDPVLQHAALFLHLACLVLGFSAVLVADYYGLLWLSRRCSITVAVRSVQRLHVPIRAGLTGLVVSGMMLEPDLADPLVKVKLGVVLALTLNGLQAGLLDKRMNELGGAPFHTGLLLWGGATAMLSQACWWGATAIGFLNRQA